MKSNKIYNSIEEISIRIIILINAGYPHVFSLEQLVILDYLNLYKIKVKTKTLHPNYHFEDLELYIHRPQIKSSLLYLISKDLIDVSLDINGIGYTANINTLWCINKLQGAYVSSLKEYSKVCMERYGKFSLEQLDKVVLAKEGR